MNIAMLSYEFPPYVNGGLGNYCKKIVEYFIKQKNRVYVFGYNPGNLPIKEYHNNLTIFRPFSKFLYKNRWLMNSKTKNHLIIYLSFILTLGAYNFLSFYKIIKLKKQGKIDIVIAHDWLNSMGGILSAIFLNIPVVFHVHNNIFSMKAKSENNPAAKVVRFMERTLYKTADKIIVPTQKMRNTLTSDGWNKNKIDVIVHGKDDELIKKSQTIEISHLMHKLDSAIETGPNTIKLLYAGRLVPEKGILNLIDSLHMVIQENVNVKLIIIGKADYVEFEIELMKRIRKMKLENHIFIYFRFLNFEEVIAHYLYSDICVFPSLYEPFGLVALEAMSLGKPVILGNGYCREAFGCEKENTAMYVNGEDPVSISSGISALLKNPSRAEEMVRNAKQLILPRFSWNRTALMTLKRYKMILKEEK